MVWSLVEDSSHKKTWLNRGTGVMIVLMADKPVMEMGRRPKEKYRKVRRWGYKISVVHPKYPEPVVTKVSEPELAVAKTKTLMMRYGVGMPAELDVFDVPSPDALIAQMKAKKVNISSVEKATKNAYKIAGGKRNLKF